MRHDSFVLFFMQICQKEVINFTRKACLLQHRQLRRSFRRHSPITFPFSCIMLICKMRALNDAAINTEHTPYSAYYSKKNTYSLFRCHFQSALAAYANIPFYAYSLPPLSHRFHSLTHAKSASWVFFFCFSFYFIL